MACFARAVGRDEWKVGWIGLEGVPVLKPDTWLRHQRET